MPAVQWSDANEKQLLLLIVNHFAPTVPLKLWDDLAKQMGADFKGEGLRKKFAKLRKEAEEAYGKPANDADEDEVINVATTTTTGATGKSAAAAKADGEANTAPKATNGKRKARGKAAVKQEDKGDDDEGEMSEEIVVAAKKAKTKTTKGKAKV